jgi:hypothetical protein
VNAFRDVALALWSALFAPRVLACLWLVVTAIALVAALAAGDAAAPHAPRFRSPTVLPADGELLAGLSVELGASLALALLLGVFFTGGILGYVGVTGRRPFRQFLIAAASGFLTNLRVFAVFALLALLLGWGLELADHALRHRWLYDREPGAVAFELGPFTVRWLHLLHAFDLGRGAAFLALLFVAKVAMAWLAGTGRRSALVGTSVALWRCATQPLRTTLILALWLALWLGLAFGIGEATVALLEVRGRLAAAAIVSQVGVSLGIAVWVGFTVCARRVASRDVLG